MGKLNQREIEFRNWYGSLVDQVDFYGPKDYKRLEAILDVAKPVTGFREVRYPKMVAAQKKAQELLNTDPEKFELAPAPTERRVLIPLTPSVSKQPRSKASSHHERS